MIRWVPHLRSITCSRQSPHDYPSWHVLWKIVLRRYFETYQQTKVEPDSEERGLMFLCLNANISRQFEFIQQTWANNTKFHGMYQDRDPLIGNQII